MTDVFVVGALHLDVVVDAHRLPHLDETLMGESVAYRFGGKGGNQAVMAARMGALVAMAGRVGNDAFANTVLAELDRSGVDRAQVMQVQGSTGMSVAIVEAGGEYGAVVVSGVNRTVDPDQVDPRNASVVVLQNEIPEDVNLRVARRATGAKIVLNAAPARQVPEALLRATDLLVVNRVEAAQLTGGKVDNLDAVRAARDLAVRGPKAVVVTLGAQGVVLCEGGKVETITPPTRADGSTHGAGDAFVGALATELARAEPLDAAVRFASAAAACFVGTSPQERAAIARSNVERWLAEL
ncbi:ribokinase [Hoeflea poritis]|uniref:Ribokinase n=1 Tax=Hoeflea poritis TaxID=2993659 RepID=A0ABT4VVC1_9HYPH|nr:ribokinase [Hoeflea poritis]MDA4848673.1 ribokinase [Hoeflea poritis]